jgi:hypothetical protein
MTSRAFTPKLALLLCALLTAAITIEAQDKAVDRIKRTYEQILKKIELSERGVEESTYAGIFCNEVIANRNDQVWPAVGNYQMRYRFYYDNAGTEGHHYPDRLRMVVMTSRMSDRSYRAEYLFNEAGALIFYYAKPDEPPIGNEPRPLEQRILLREWPANKNDTGTNANRSFERRRPSCCRPCHRRQQTD